MGPLVLSLALSFGDQGRTRPCRQAGMRAALAGRPRFPSFVLGVGVSSCLTGRKVYRRPTVTKFFC